MHIALAEFHALLMEEQLEKGRKRILQLRFYYGLDNNCSHNTYVHTEVKDCKWTELVF